MSVSALRKLSISPEVRGFWDGVKRGMASTDDSFDVRFIRLNSDIFVGLRTDGDALRKDVERAESKFAGSLSKER